MKGCQQSMGSSSSIGHQYIQFLRSVSDERWQLCSRSVPANDFERNELESLSSSSQPKLNQA
jgi:hypothetical protein